MGSESVYLLVGQLIESVGRQTGVPVDDVTLKKCKSLAFGVLLGKQQRTVTGDAVTSPVTECGQRSEADQLDAIEMLQCHEGDTRLRARYQYEVDRCDRLGRLIADIDRHVPMIGGKRQLDELDQLTVQFLMRLRNSNPHELDGVPRHSFFGSIFVPAARIGRYFVPQDIRFDEAKFSTYYGLARSNPYLTQPKPVDFFSSVVKRELRAAQIDLPERERSHFCNPMAVLNSFQGPFRSCLLRSGREPTETEPFARSEIVRTTVASAIRPPGPPSRIIQRQNWENLGQLHVPEEKPFVSECDSLFHLKTLEAMRLNRPADIKIVPLEDFLRDVKYLLTGVGSRIFVYGEMNRFVMMEGITVDGIAPESMRTLMDEFMDIGTSFRRLQKMTRKNPHNQSRIREGFVFQAFCESIEQVLACFRVAVHSYTGHSLPQLLHKLNRMIEQLLTVAKFCGLNPKHEDSREFPTGSMLLDQLHREMTQVTQPEMAALFLYMLKQCSNAYFGIFQRWLFGGQLQDPTGELFICFIDHYRPNTKHFFDKAHLIRRQTIPGFLRGYEDDILLCGKYTMLLKAFRPTHPLFSLKIPKLTVCLSYGSIATLQTQWQQYVENARALCGPTVSVRGLHEAKRQEQEAFQRIVEESVRKNVELWRYEQEQKALELRRKKQRLNEELVSQLHEIQEAKQQAKRQELEYELRVEQQRLEVENRKLLAENLAQEREVEGYRQLNRMMDDRMDRLKVQIADMGVDGSSENDFQSCRNSQITLEDEGSVYEDAQKSPNSVGSYEDASRSAKTGDGSGEENDNTLVESCESVPREEQEPFCEEQNDKISLNEVSEGQRNREKVLGSCLGVHLNEDKENANIQSTVVSNVTTRTGLRKLTEAQRNKLKILSQEFELPSSDVDETDVNCNKLAERQRNRHRILLEDYTSREDEPTADTAGRELTELQKNRMKIMSQEYNVILDDEDHSTVGKSRSRTMYLNLDTDRARNRRKILESEFDIATGAQKFPDTPMSVDSDTISEELQVPMLAINGELQHDLNANPIAPTGRLSLNTAMASERFNEKAFGIPETATLLQKTPDSALNTAGLEARQGFEFPSTGGGKFRKSYSICPVEQSAQHRPTNFCALAKNFDGKMKITDDPQRPVAITRELHGVDVLSLTRFFQRSLAIPLKAHMEIVNNEILKMYLQDLDILGHFESLRNYFLLMDGEFSSHICDSLFKMLDYIRSPGEMLNYQTLHTVLNGALGSSAAGSNPNSDRLSFIVHQIPEKFDLYHPNVFSMLNLSYRVEWPLNLILNPETIEQYTNVFKYLVKVRRVSFALENSFQLLKETNKRHGKLILASPQYSRVQLIRHKLSHLVNALKNYITSSALQGSWETFRKDLETTETMEDLYRKHTVYVKRILFLCLLNKKSVEFYNNIEEIFRVVLRFYRHLRAKEWRLEKDKSHYVHPKYAQILNDESDFEKLIKYMIYLGNKMYQHGYQKDISEFLQVININGYYDGETVSRRSEQP